MRNLKTVMDVLFDQFDRLNEPALTREELADQIERSKAVVMVSKQLVEVGKLGLDAMRLKDDMMGGDKGDEKVLSLLSMGDQ